MASSTNKLFIFFIISVFIIFFTAFLYYGVVIGLDNEPVTFLFLSLFLSSFVGAIFFLPSHLEFIKDKNYNLITAICNYFLMLTESSIMILGFSLSDREAGWYSQWFFILLYIFFGIHLFSYPRSLGKSLSLLLAPAVFIFFNIFDNPNNSILLIINSLSKAGYLFTLALIIAGFWLFFRIYLSNRNINKKSNSKIAAIYSVLYALFILIPGLWYLLPGLVNYFKENSLYLLFLSIFYFIYTLIKKIKSLTGEMTRFVTITKTQPSKKSTLN